MFTLLFECWEITALQRVVKLHENVSHAPNSMYTFFSYIFVPSIALGSFSGVPDVCVGAYGDDDTKGGSGTDRGAVYILFLNRDGTVKAEQKISDTQGGLTAALDPLDSFGASVASIGDLNNE